MDENIKIEELSQTLKSEGEVIIERLMKSFSDLESAVESARANLLKVEKVPSEVIARLDSYQSIITKQRSLARNLEQSVNSGDVAEVGRQIGLINGLSSMIIDDARGILSGLNDQSDVSNQDETSFC